MNALQEDNGNTSSIRIIAMYVSLAACAVALLGVWKGTEPIGLASLVTGMLASVLGFKAHQKGKEQ